MTTPTIVIAGAGIGGLTAASTLQQRGMAATVVERAQTLRPLGVGINPLPHAVRRTRRARPGQPIGRHFGCAVCDLVLRQPRQPSVSRAPTDVIAATREMHAAGTERGEDIARVTTKYRNDTERSTS